MRDYCIKIEYGKIKIFEGGDYGDGGIMACFTVLIILYLSFHEKYIRTLKNEYLYEYILQCLSIS